MRFNLYKTSDFTPKKKPIDDPRVKEVGHVYDIEDYPNKDRIWCKIYTIDINTIDELLEFIDKYGRVIIAESIKDMGYYDYLEPQPYTEKYFIEIYDDWRE